MADVEAELSPEALKIIEWQRQNPDNWGDQDENGVDLARLRENLKLTPAERIEQHERARFFALRLKAAGDKHREQNRRT